jgi:hypothetical protein
MTPLHMSKANGRLALRVEGEFWNAYYAMPGTMRDAIFLGSIRMKFAEPDYVTIVENATGAETKLEVVQVWCDPDYPEAHRDPALREYLIRRAKEGVGALVRFSERKAIHLMAPPLSNDGQWHEIAGENVRPQHSPAEIAAVVGPTTVTVSE